MGDNHWVFCLLPNVVVQAGDCIDIDDPLSSEKQAWSELAGKGVNSKRKDNQWVADNEHFDAHIPLVKLGRKEVVAEIREQLFLQMVPLDDLDMDDRDHDDRFHCYDSSEVEHIDFEKRL